MATAKGDFEITATIASFGGTLLKLKHTSKSTRCSMSLNLYLPPQAKFQTVPVLFYLSGLTCTGDNCAEKGFFQAHAAKHGIAIVYPDTSPRGLSIKGEDESWDFGSGAGFYVDATEEPWREGYNMYTYIVEELPVALYKSFPELEGERVGITGHSMGGHGALTIVSSHTLSRTNPSNLTPKVSSFATPPNTAPSPPSPPSPTPPTAPGVRKPLAATSAHQTLLNGRNTMPQSLSKLSKVQSTYSST
jgi:S-formylglutathione hydrolase